MLTLDCSDHTIPVFDHFFEEFVCLLQLQLVALESLSEIRTVHIAVAELQRRMNHLVHRSTL